MGTNLLIYSVSIQMRFSLNLSFIEGLKTNLMLQTIEKIFSTCVCFENNKYSQSTYMYGIFSKYLIIFEI